MIPNWNKILKEWSYRVGVIKPNNSEHLYHLNNILEERGWPHEVINGVIDNLTEAEADVVAPTLKQAREKAKMGQTFSSPRSKKVYTRGKEEDGESETPKFDSEEDEQRTSLRNIDHETTDKALRMTKSDAEKQALQKGKKGVGAGTPESRAGEAASHYALRKIQDGVDIKEIKSELMEIAKDKNNILTKEWVNGAIECATYIKEKYGDGIDEIVWDTPSGRELINVEGHGTSSDMFITLKDGKRIGISLKKDGKVFILNGGYKEQFKNLTQLLEKSGLPEEKINNLMKAAGIETYNKDRKQQFEEGVAQLIDVENRELTESEIEYFLNNLDDAKSKSKFGPGAEKYLKILTDNPGLDALSQKAVDGKLKGDEMKAISKLAKSSKKIREKLPEVYGEMRNCEIRLTQRILKEANDPDVEDSLKDVVTEGIHIEEILGLKDNPNLDEFITLYGEKGGAELSKKTLFNLFGGELENLHEIKEQFRGAKSPKEKDKIKKQIIEDVKSKIFIDKKDGARDGVIKIKHEDGTEYPVFTIKSRTKPIGTAPGLEMAQTNFMSNALKFGFNTDEWPDTQFNNYTKKQIDTLIDDWDGSPPPDVKKQIDKLKSDLR